MARTGQCHCGAVRYAVEGNLPFIVHCHCTNCRRAHGAAFFTGAFVRNDQFEVTAGEHQLQLMPFHGDAPGGRVFCKTCGSHVFNRLEMLPGIMNFSLATLDEPLESADAIHINTESKVPWLQLPADAEQYEAFPPDLPQRLETLR